MSLYSEKFEKAIKFMLQNEGGYVNDPSDPGGETKYGISKRSYPRLNIKTLSLDEAKKIYYYDFWLKGKFEQIPNENIAIQLFDLSVNLGIRPAITILQRALRSAGIRVQEDGLLGPQTLSATIFSEPLVLLVAIKSEAAGYYRTLAAQQPNLKQFLNGWLNRVYQKIN